jgi:hypothetical protein
MVRQDKVARAAAVSAGAIFPGFTMGIRADATIFGRECRVLSSVTLFRIDELYKRFAGNLVDSSGK